MSRRIKTTVEPLVLKGVSTLEWRLKNYLHQNNIYKGNDSMQTVIINSFFCQFLGDNEAEWKVKIIFTHANFGRFAQYAQNNWKIKTQNTP